ncbi:hypothetical protein NLJ89_g6537 [Agrocybe chaxingu]|uniref:Uncharacterized protein n=1 Tax=Agrocybe chaxingu TaxID=84603 RepID=A0A9W8K0L8_9AGAR|nr:hypothetical protein NLJ89_g6537 [Agrocybe chaxingu]
MKSVFAPLAAVLLAATSAVAQQLTVNTPLSVVVCQPLLITWTGGTPPYFLVRRNADFVIGSTLTSPSLLPGNEPSANAILDFGTLTTTQLSWNVNITAGTSLGLTLRDSTGAISQSAPFTVQSGSDTSCLNGGSTTSTTGGGGATTTTGTTTGATTTAPPTTTRATTTNGATTGTNTSPSTTTSGTGAPAQSTDAAYNVVAKTGLAGAIGAILVALLA